MSDATITVRPIALADCQWQFRDSAPHWQHRDYGAAATLDPFPAYGHDLGQAQEAARHVASVCPPLWDVEVFVADREEVGRSNGFSSLREGGHYEGETWVKDPPTGLIFLSGKRVPPHPAMTRYLVAHEYGHNVEWMLNHIRGAKHARSDALVTDYAKVRGLPPESIHHGHGGVWHDSVTEIFACDFRILACGVEEEFWPHPGVGRPEQIDGLAGWWTQAVEDLQAAREGAAA